MKSKELIQHLVKHTCPTDEVVFLYGHSELAVVDVSNGSERGERRPRNDVIITLEEKRDLSDSEKHDPQEP